MREEGANPLDVRCGDEYSGQGRGRGGKRQAERVGKEDGEEEERWRRVEMGELGR